MTDVTPHQPDPSRRTVVMGAAWSIPVIAAAIAAPMAAATTVDPDILPEHAGLNHNGSVRADNAQTNPRAWAYGTPGEFSAQGDHRIRVTIVSTGAAAAAGHSISLVVPGTQTPAPLTQLNGWTIVSATPTQVVLEWPTPVTGSGFDTLNVEWYFTELDVDGAVVDGAPAAATGSVTITGAITGTGITDFDEGTVVGPA